MIQSMNCNLLIVKSDLTDHYPIFCVINKNFTNNKKKYREIVLSL